MSQHDAFLALYGKHDTVEAAVCKIIEDDLDMKRFSTVGRGCHTDEEISGFHSASVSHSAGGDA